MRYLSIFAILFSLLLFSSSAYGYTASKFVSDYGDDLSEGQKINVLVKVKGEPESENLTKRAKEIRYLQSAVLKFTSFAGATNVKSDSWNNQFTAIVTTSLAKVLEERSDVISVQVIDSFSTTQEKKIASKIWLITSDEFGCSSKNQEGIEFLQSTAFVYFTLYGVNSEFDTAQCLYISQVENNPDNFLHSLQNYDLPIIVFDTKISSPLFSLENDHHLKLEGYEKPHVVFCYCSIPALSHTATWELSHQLSHFILDLHGELTEISQDWVHDAESESVNCINIRRQEGLCSDRWTPVYGDSSQGMMTVKIHPDYFVELSSIDQLLLSQEHNKKIQPQPAFRNMIYDLVPNIDVKLTDLSVIPMDDKPKDPFDNSDVIVISFEIENQGLDYFVVNAKMFEILVLDPSFPIDAGVPENSYIIDNYSTLYDVELETIYDDYYNLEIFSECEYYNDRIFVNQSKTFSICFEVLRKWNNEVLNIQGPKHYFLTLMDNTHTNSCPNCKYILLDNYHELEKNDRILQNISNWLSKLSQWRDSSLISEKEFTNAIEFLKKKGIIIQSPYEIKETFNEVMLKSKTNLTMADFTNSRFNEGEPIVFSGKLTDSLGEPIPEATILIKGDGPCPSNHIIAQGLTDKHGRYKIYTHAQLWDERDGLITTMAEFTGTNSLESSHSDSQIVVVYAVKGEKCVG